MRILDRFTFILLFLRERCSRGLLDLRLLRLRAPSFRAASCAALATALAGCEGNGSVAHNATLEAKPDMLCMRQALETLPGISNVQYVHEVAGEKQEFEELSYHAEGQRVMLMVQPDRVYSQTFLRMSPFRSEELTPRVRRVMARVDAAMEKACHIRNLSRRVTETCMDAAHPDGKCPPLAP